MSFKTAGLRLVKSIQSTALYWIISTGGHDITLIVIPKVLVIHNFSVLLFHIYIFTTSLI